MHRRRFLRWALLSPFAAILGGSAILQACGGEETTANPTGGSTPPTSPGCDGTGADSMTGTHVHPLCISAAILAAPADGTIITLESGGTGHTHTITLSAAQIVDIRDNLATVNVTSSLTGHTHSVTFLA